MSTLNKLLITYFNDAQLKIKDGALLYFCNKFILRLPFWKI